MTRSMADCGCFVLPPARWRTPSIGRRFSSARAGRSVCGDLCVPCSVCSVSHACQHPPQYPPPFVGSRLPPMLLFAAQRSQSGNRRSAARWRRPLRATSNGTSDQWAAREIAGTVAVVRREVATGTLKKGLQRFREDSRRFRVFGLNRCGFIVATTEEEVGGPACTAEGCRRASARNERSPAAGCLGPVRCRRRRRTGRTPRPGRTPPAGDPARVQSPGGARLQGHPALHVSVQLQ